MPSRKPNGQRLNGRGSHWIGAVQRMALYLRDGFTCQYCGRDLHDAPPREVTLDHLRPQCRGGSHAARNLITACLACNSRRQHEPWRAYATAGAVTRITRTIRRVPNRRLASAIVHGRITRAQARLEARSM